MAANPRPDRRIGDHGIIGDLDTAALVARDGTIDYLCWPHLDSPTIFGGLLDPDRGGEMAIVPDLDARATQLYLPDTNVLVTRWLSAAGSAEVTDLLVHPEAGPGEPQRLIRRVRATRGTVRFRMTCRPRFDYARAVPAASPCEGGVLFASDALSLRLDGSVPLTCRDGEAEALFTLERGEDAWFMIGDAATPAIAGEAAALLLDRTAAAWQRWARRSTYRGRWREAVTRSALALKLLTSARHGSVAAAATFGLPEAPGAERNWDYRATWIRDASFTVYAFMRLGYTEEAESFRRWVGARIMDTGESEPLRIMYALDGSEMADETSLPHLAGYAGSTPVRIGNGAHNQRQLDIFGELLDSAYLSNKYGAAISHTGWSHVRRIVETVCEHWRDADAGIWEIRAEPREFLHSRLMCWVAIDRAIRLAVKRSLPAPIDRWHRERDLIVEDIWANFRHPEHGYFVQVRGGRDLDASLLLMPLVRFVSATDPVWLDTLDAIGQQLSHDGLVYRYCNADGLTGDEGAFTTCTFWYIECLARAGRLDEAQLLMAKALGYANRLGLFSEELSAAGDQLGNFPQALTHLAFISAAYFLDRQLDHPQGQVWQP